MTQLSRWKKRTYNITENKIKNTRDFIKKLQEILSHMIS